MQPQPTEIERHDLEPDGPFPNNPDLLLRVYRQAVKPDPGDPATTFEKLFVGNGWGGTWRNSIFPFHHYHSNAHEVLGIAAGHARVQFGGPPRPCSASCLHRGQVCRPRWPRIGE